MDLKQARNNKKLSQQELADLSGISLRTIQRIENNEVKAQPHTLRKILEVIGEPEESENTDHLRVMINIQASALLFPLLAFIFSFLFYRKINAESSVSTSIRRLLSISLYFALLSPILVIGMMGIITSLGVPLSIRFIPTPLLLYEVLAIIYLISLRRINKENQVENALKGVPSVF